MDPAERIQHTREVEMERIERNGVRPIHSPVQLAIVGVSFTEHYPENLQDLQLHQMDAETMGEALAVVIIHNPNNEHDANACQVHVPALGDIGMIGHLPRPVAARIAPELDAGVRWRGSIERVRINPDHPDRPGIDIRLERVTNG